MESLEDDKEVPPRRTESWSQEDATSPTKMTQTPLTSYMVHQTPEARRLAIGKKSIAVTSKTEEMSSSFGSPQLKPRKGWRMGARRKEEEVKKKKEMSSKIKKITSFFECKPEEAEKETAAVLPGTIPKCTMMCSQRGDKTNQRARKSEGGHFETQSSSE